MKTKAFLGMKWLERIVASTVSLCLLVGQINLIGFLFLVGSSQSAEAARLGTNTLSAGSAPPPASSSVQSFQPDLFTGRASTGISVAVPPGRKGMQPSVGLSYSSSGRNSWIGVGWTLDMGFIERSTRTGVPTYTDSDIFVFSLQGVSSELVKIADGTYRSRDEGGFLKIERQVNDSWQFTDKSGTRYLFGQNATSRVSFGTNLFRWHLDKVVDLKGNFMIVNYTKIDGIAYPVSIEYAGHEGTSTAPANQVRFVLEDRADIENGYRSGFLLKSSKRLAAIETLAKVNGNLTLASRYVLTYRSSSRTGRSLLSNVQRFGTDGVTGLPPVSFDYQDTVAPSYTVVSNDFTTGRIAWNVRVAGLDTGHDNFGPIPPYAALPYGSPEVVANHRNIGGVDVDVSTTTGSVHISAGVDYFVHAWTAVYLSTASVISFARWGTPNPIDTLWIEDSDGMRGPFWPNTPEGFGGLSFRSGWSILHYTGYHQHESFAFGLDAPFASKFEVINPAVITEPQTAGDIDGNGISDVINFDSASRNWSVSLGQPTGTLGPQISFLSEFGEAGSLPLLGDWNGDGRTDVAAYTAGKWRFAASSGTNFTPSAIPDLNFGVGSPFTGDFNGDGIMDIGTFRRGYWEIAIGSGNGFSPATYTVSKAAVGGGGNPFPGNYSSARDLMQLAHITQDGFYAIDPDGPGGSEPFSIYCLMSLAGGGWTRLNSTVTASLLNQDQNLEREYLFENQGRWYRSPMNQLVWDWTPGQGKDAFGSWNNSRDGAFTISRNNSSPEPTHFGVSASAGPGITTKVYLGTDSDQDPANGLVELYIDQPNVFDGNPQPNVAVYIRERSSAEKFWFGSASATQLTGDFNGDGLTDIAVTEAGVVTVGFCDGKQFIEQPEWTVNGLPSQEVFSADFNGDGLSDLAFYDRTQGKIMVAYSNGAGFSPPAPLSVSLTFSQRSSQDQVQLADFNGDSLPDPAVFNSINGSSEFALSRGGNPDLLLTIHNGLGGSTSISYEPASYQGNNFLPFLAPVVTATQSSDGLGNTYTTTYSYSGGLYDGVSREFRGFAEVRVRDAQGNVSVSHFHQDDTYKGRVEWTEFRDLEGKLFNRTEQTYMVVFPYPGTDARFIKPTQTDNYLYDGDATVKHTRSRTEYDSFGNITDTYLDGDADRIGDERRSHIEYTVNMGTWILNRPKLAQTFDATGNVMTQKKMYYDGALGIDALPDKGNLTKEEEWLDRDRLGAQNRWISTSMAYDAYGNVQSITDSLNHTVNNTYDNQDHTYLIQVSNPLGHTRSMVYDPRFGHVLASTDQNGVTTSSEYDVLGRVSKIIGPLDSPALPTSRYEYDLTSNPSRVTQYTRVVSGEAKELVSYIFTDGLGHTVQVRSPAQNPAEQVVTGTVEYDNRGKVIRQWTPYRDTFSATYRPHTIQEIAQNLAAPVVHTYDAPGRLLKTTDPDGTSSSIIYDDWTVTTIDAKGHKKSRISDAFGRLVEVQEFEGTGENAALYASTRYQYDDRDNLILLTDAVGNTTTLQYDSLNRKTSMTDPDMGTWTYAYDDVDKLTAQTDARGVSILFSYDALNRQTRKDYQIPPNINVPTDQPPVIYSYDNPLKQFSKGKLTEITDASGSSSFAYDMLGRLITEQKTVDGNTYTIQRVYDLLGRLTTLTYPNNDVAAYTYNDQGGIQTITLQSAGQPVQPIINSVDYNSAGQITKMVYGNDVTTDYSYNPQTLRLDKLKSVGPGGVLQDFTYSFDPVGNVSAIADAVHSASQTFTYDSLNRLATANGVRYGNFTYAYNQIGNMIGKEGVTQNYGPLNNKPHAVADTSSGLALTYDANGNLASKSGPNRPAQTFVFDAENRLVEVSSPTPYRKLDPGWNFVSFPQIVGEVPVTAALTNFAGNCEQLTRFNTRSNWFESFVNLPGTNQFDTVSATNGYALYVTNAAGIYLPLGDTPAPAGPRLLPVGTNFLAGPPDIMSATNWLASLVPGVDYDQVFCLNPTTRAPAPVTTVRPGEAYYVRMLRPANWTPPTAAHIANPSTVRFVYDGDGGRVKKITWKGATLFVGQSYEVSAEGQTTTYVFAGGQRVAAKGSNGSLRIYHSDHLGSANIVTDQAGSTIELTENTPYGSVSRQEGSVNVAHKFTGQRLDGETGLYFYNARYYDPEVGRFISADIFAQDFVSPQTFNRYAYAGNNPVIFVDPSGHFAFLIPFAIAAFKGALIGAAFGTSMAAITGQNIGQGALFGAISGAITGGFGHFASGFQGPGSGNFFARAAINSLGSATASGVTTAMRGGNWGKAAFSSFRNGMAIAGANYAVGQWSGYSKDRVKILGKDGNKTSALPSGKVGINGITETQAEIKERMATEGYDGWLYNDTRGGLADLVESGQEIFFGPSEWSRSAAGVLDVAAASGGVFHFVAHSQGGLLFGNSLGLMKNSFNDNGSFATFINTPFTHIAADSAGRSAGLSDVIYRAHAFDIVSALGAPHLLPTAIISLPVYGATGAEAHSINVWGNQPSP